MDHENEVLEKWRYSLFKGADWVSLVWLVCGSCGFFGFAADFSHSGQSDILGQHGQPGFLPVQSGVALP